MGAEPQSLQHLEAEKQKRSQRETKEEPSGRLGKNRLHATQKQGFVEESSSRIHRRRRKMRAGHARV